MKSASICPVEEKQPSSCNSVSHQEASSAINTAGSVSTDKPDSQADSETSLQDNFTKLEVFLVYWSCHRIPDHNGTIYCKLKIGENQNVESKRVVVFSQDDGPGFTYSAHLCGHLVEAGRIASCEEGNRLLQKVDSYRLRIEHCRLE